MTSPLGGARSIQLSYRGRRACIVAFRFDTQKWQSGLWSHDRRLGLTRTNLLRKPRGMKTPLPRSFVRLASAAGVLSLAVAAHANPPSPDARAAQVGSALPDGAVISARSVILTPVAGGDSTAVPVGADGSFSAAGLAPGRYTLRVASVTVPRQTQGASFGEKVNQGLQATGGALASGASVAAPGTAGAVTPVAESQGRLHLHNEGIVHRDLAARMPAHVTVGGQPSRAVDVDGGGVAVEVPSNGAIAGVVVGVIAARQ